MSNKAKSRTSCALASIFIDVATRDGNVNKENYAGGVSPSEPDPWVNGYLGYPLTTIVVNVSCGDRTVYGIFFSGRGMSAVRTVEAYSGKAFLDSERF